VALVLSRKIKMAAPLPRKWTTNNAPALKHDMDIMLDFTLRTISVPIRKINIYSKLTELLALHSVIYSIMSTLDMASGYMYFTILRWGIYDTFTHLEFQKDNFILTILHA